MKFINMKQINEYMLNRQVSLGMNFGLTRMEILLEKIGNPHHSLQTVHIAGSNGKGSTLNYMKEILITEGVTVASFTSPFLEKVNEQLMIDHDMISDEAFIAYFQRIYPIIVAMDETDMMPTEFEILTALAFLYFEESQPDLVLVETGLGGRLDTTNVLMPLLSIITTISLEHTNILGNSLAEIAGEKAGIIKKAVPVITGVRDKEPLQVIKAKAADEKADLYVIDEHIMISNSQQNPTSQSFSLTFRNQLFDHLQLNMLGRHQIDNAVLAIAAIELLNNQYSFTVKKESIYDGLLVANWKGRFEIWSEHIILDGAHNPAGMSVLVETLQSRYPDYEFCFVFTALKDKNYQEMLRLIEGTGGSLLITEIDHVRAAKAEDLYACSQSVEKKLFKNWEEALCAGLEQAKASTLTIITGSLYFLSLARTYLENKNH